MGAGSVTLGAWLRGGGDRETWERAHYACCGKKRTLCGVRSKRRVPNGKEGVGMGALVDRLKGAAPGAAAAAPPTDKAFQEKYPGLWEFMTEISWGDGKPRTPATVNVFAESGTWKACLHDRATGLVAFVASPSFLGLWTVLEKGLQDDKLDWRASSARPGQGSRR